MKRILGLLIALAALGSNVLGQNDGGEAPGKGDVQVHVEIRVLGPDDRPIARALTVRLMFESEGGTLWSVNTNSEGVAQLNISHSGTYNVEVSGPGIETTRGNAFTVLRWDRSRQEVVHVRLKDSVGGTGAAGGGVTSAKAFAVPKEASKEFDDGVASMRASDWKKAQEHFQNAITKYPNFDQAYDNLGMALQNGGDTAGAKTAYEKALSLNDHNADAQRNLARLYEAEGNWKGAEDLLVKSLGIEPNNAGSLTLLAIAQLKQGKVDEAIASASRVHALEHKSYATAHLVLAQAYESKGRNKEAIAEYQLFLSEEPNGARSEAVKKKVAKLQAAG